MKFLGRTTGEEDIDELVIEEKVEGKKDRGRQRITYMEDSNRLLQMLKEPMIGSTLLMTETGSKTMLESYLVVGKE